MRTKLESDEVVVAGSAENLPMHDSPEARERVLKIPVPYITIYNTKYLELRSLNPDGSPQVMDSNSHSAAAAAQEHMLLALPGRYPAAPDSWRVVRELAKSFRERPDFKVPKGNEGFEGRSVAFDIPYPGDLLELIGSAEKVFTPDFIKRKREYWLMHFGPRVQGHVAEFEDRTRLQAYEGIFAVIYGDRWKVYKELAGFQDFEHWRAELDLIKHSKTEEQAMLVAKTVLDNLSPDEANPRNV